MTSATSVIDGSATAQSRSAQLPWGLIAALSGVAAVWVLYILQLRFHWGSESYYNYGWFVPILAGYLFWRRWEERPTAEPISERTRVVLLGLMTVAVVLIVPFRMFSEVNPFWRQPLLLQGALVFLISCGFVYGLGGRAYLRHFVYPLLFLLTMVPWPFVLEQQIIFSLTEKVTHVTTWVLQLVGYPAEFRGSSIHIVGLDSPVTVGEACSGIRSLQTLGVAAFFLGEFFFLSLWRRLVLLGLGVILMMVFNNLRSVALTFAMLDGGMEAYEKWHDPMGWISFGMSIILLYGASELLNLGNRRQEIPPTRLAPRWSSPGMSTAFLGVGVLIAGLGVEGWFRYHERVPTPPPGWTIQWPAEVPGKFEHATMPDQVIKLLSYDYGDRGTLTLSPRAAADVYFYGYTGENRMAAVSSYGHSPDICITSAGGTFLGKREPLHVQIGAANVALEHFLFTIPTADGSREQLNVFFNVTEQRSQGMDPNQLRSLNWSSQVDQVLRGRRDYARQVFLTAIYGIKDPERARQSMTSIMAKIGKADPEGHGYQERATAPAP